MSANAIEFINVSKKFRKGEKMDSLRDFIPNLVKRSVNRNARKDELKDQEFWAVRDVSFQLKKGEALGIIGPNGAGKSTILKILSRILRPTTGEMKINGKLSALLEVGAGFHPDLTGRENIYLSGAIVGMKKKEIDQKLDSIIEFSELEDFIDTPVKRYSSGMYVRLGFSVAIHMNPEILLIDEVLAVGDISFQKKCLQKIQDIIKSNVTIIYISHNLESVRRLCPTSIFLDKGKVIFSGETKQTIEFYLKSVNERFIASEKTEAKKITSNHKEGDQDISIKKITLHDSAGIQSSEFKTGNYMRIEIVYSARQKLINPTFAVGFCSGGQLFSDHNSRFEGNDIEFINGTGKISLIIEKLLLLPGFYEANVYLADKDSIVVYDMKTALFSVRELKRGYGLFYHPHLWELGEKQSNKEIILR